MPQRPKRKKSKRRREEEQRKKFERELKERSKNVPDDYVPEGAHVGGYQSYEERDKAIREQKEQARKRREERAKRYQESIQHVFEDLGERLAHKTTGAKASDFDFLFDSIFEAGGAKAAQAAYVEAIQSGVLDGVGWSDTALEHPAFYQGYPLVKELKAQDPETYKRFKQEGVDTALAKLTRSRAAALERLRKACEQLSRVLTARGK